MEPASRTPEATYRADWYPDPTGRFEFRYHNGQAWTGDVSVDGNRFLDPLQPAGYPASGAGGFGPKPPGSGKASAALVLGITSLLLGWVPFLAFLAVAGAVLACIFGSLVLRRDARLRAAGGSNPRGHGMALAGLILSPLALVSAGLGIWLSVLAIREVDEFQNVGRHTVEITSCAVTSGVAKAEGTITNDESSTKSYHLSIDFIRPGTDNELYTDGTDIDDVAPGDAREWSVFVVVTQEQLDCRVDKVTGPLPFGQS